MTTEHDVVIVGGGIAGGALAATVAAAGRSVLVLERTTAYRDRVRGEYVQPWGVAELQRVGLFDVLLAAGGNVMTTVVPYDDTVEPAEAEQMAVTIADVLPGVPGSLGISHPVACEALNTAAVERGARVERGVESVEIMGGPRPSVVWSAGGTAQETTCRVIVGADGRESAVRRQAGIELHSNPARLLGAGLMVEGVDHWPVDTFTVGSEDDRVFFVVALGNGRARLYLLHDAAETPRYAGATKAARFLEDFALRSLPGGEEFAAATPVGPCAVYPMFDSWTDSPVADGVVLVGDAAGFSDPHIGQGLSVAARDVRSVADVLVADDWSAEAFGPYVEERTERMRRLRWVNDLVTTIRGEFGPEKRERKRRAFARMREQPELAAFRRSTLTGPETAPAEAFDPSVVERLLAE